MVLPYSTMDYGANALDDLKDVNFTSITNGDLIKYDGSNLINFAPTYLEGSGIPDNFLIKIVSGATTQTNMIETSVLNTSTALKTYVPTSSLSILAGTIETEAVTGGSETRMHLSSKGIAVADGITVSSSGNVGIGVQAATSKLHVVGDTYIDGSLEIDGTLTADGSTGTAGQVLTSNGSSPAFWASAPAKRLFQAYTSGTQTAPNGAIINTWNTSNTRHIDTENALNSSHGLVSNQYIISTAGYWRIQSHVVFSNSPGDSAYLTSYLRINGAHLTNSVFNMCQLADSTHNPDQQGVSVSAILELAVGNSVDVFINQFTVQPLANVTNAMFECEYLGPA